jgi:hypothetical protein
MSQDIKEIIQARDEIIEAGAELLERLNLWLLGDGDLCQNRDQPCWNKDGGTIDAFDTENPARCTVCRETCDCSRCNDLAAINRWYLAVGQVPDYKVGQ